MVCGNTNLARTEFFWRLYGFAPFLLEILAKGSFWSTTDIIISIAEVMWGISEALMVTGRNSELGIGLLMLTLAFEVEIILLTTEPL